MMTAASFEKVSMKINSTKLHSTTPPKITVFNTESTLTMSCPAARHKRFCASAHFYDCDATRSPPRTKQLTLYIPSRPDSRQLRGALFFEGGLPWGSRALIRKENGQFKVPILAAFIASLSRVAHVLAHLDGHHQLLQPRGQNPVINAKLCCSMYLLKAAKAHLSVKECRTLWR